MNTKFGEPEYMAWIPVYEQGEDGTEHVEHYECSRCWYKSYRKYAVCPSCKRRLEERYDENPV